jgi:hypothetical protein
MERIARRFAYWVASTESPSADFFQSRSRVNGLYIGSRIETDLEFEDWLSTQVSSQEIVKAVASSQHLREFENTFASWVMSHTTNQLTGLDQYQADYSEGSTQAFDSFYFRQRQRRFRCFVGEYFYHLKTWQANQCNWAWTDGSDLAPGDALVISVPFCDTAAQVENLDALLEQCSRLGVPVLLDLCYYVISTGININLEHKCIDTVAFSLSKSWPVSTARIGMRYTRPDTFDGQKLHSSIGYNNNLGAYIGNKIIQGYKPDWAITTRQHKYNKICSVLDLMPTSSVNFAIGDARWNRYSRKELLKSYQLDFDSALFVNRICLNKVYQHWDLFKKCVKHELDIEI